MERVEYQFFDNLRMYHTNSTKFNNLAYTRQYPARDMDLLENDFHKYSHDLGNYMGNIIDKRSRTFYTSLVNYMVEISNDRYYKREDFRMAESSIVSSLNYFMGMIASKAVAEKEYGVAKLYHLTDDHNLDILFSKNNIKQPDFIGLNHAGEPVIIEAKGTNYGKLSTTTTENAYEQLEAIDQVHTLDKHGFPREIFRSLNKHIVISTYYKSGNDQLTFQDIDPESKGEEILEVNFNLLTYSYYENYMLDLLNHPRKTFTIGNTTIVSVELPNYIVGLDERIYNKLSEHKEVYNQKKKLKLSTVNDTLYETIENILESTEKIEPYYYNDGVYFKYKGNEA